MAVPDQRLSQSGHPSPPETGGQISGTLRKSRFVLPRADEEIDARLRCEDLYRLMPLPLLSKDVQLGRR